MPLQSGSDQMLALMKRRYKSRLYKERVVQIKQLMPHACIGVDVIVGFPGETDDFFKETFDFISDLEVSYLHVFTYSERPNTPAASMSEKVPMEVRRRRNQSLRRLSEKKKQQFYRAHLGGTRSVLFERDRKASMITGFTDNYIKIELPYEKVLINTVGAVRLISINAQGLVSGELVATNVLS